MTNVMSEKDRLMLQDSLDSGCGDEMVTSSNVDEGSQSSTCFVDQDVANPVGESFQEHLQMSVEALEAIQPAKLDEASRLKRDSVLEYQQDVNVPDWYILETTGGSSRDSAKFHIIHGDAQGLPDTQAFLEVLLSLHKDRQTLLDRVAAAGLFCWEDDLYVARAPGRLDVMGGIADYSGCLVLQMPLREACHVAVQCNPPHRQPLWEHTAARQLAQGGELEPAIQIVSFGSELSNRSPIFEMDLRDLYDSKGSPISYEAARTYFEQDPLQKWAAYVAGTILVLVKELGVRFEDGINILVSSAVPEGKGVSSSAALEVAAMSAIAAACGLEIAPRDLAILCQKVENLVVGAPCGIMDQMASACGEANKLLAMVCQPAEVKEHVSIPSHLRFWGIDSGIRHSVGGADYGSVRIGAFMGRKIIQSTAIQLSSSMQRLCQHHDPELHFVTHESHLNYLCNIPPHRYEHLYKKYLPETLSGHMFLESHGTHNDPVTKIHPHQHYPVKSPTAHPIYENFRVQAFSSLLTSPSSPAQLSSLAELMYQSHYSYSNCGLGSDGTDTIVKLVKLMQSSDSLLGAKITGGGSGGTVCVLTSASEASRNYIVKIQRRYQQLTGHVPHIFQGSSPGAAQFGYLRIRLTAG